MEVVVDPVTLIVGALAAGALKGVGESASAVVKDAYQALKAAVRTKFEGKPSAEVVLAEHEKDPDTYERPLAQQVRQTGLDQDARVVQLAQELMALMDADGSRAGKYNVNMDGAQGVQVGDGATQTNYFNGR
jgi:hypothetical protein